MQFSYLQFQCCGIIDEEDYEKSLWKSQALGGEDLVYPLSCCKLSNANDLSSYLNPMAVNQEKCMSSDIRLNGVDRHQQVIHKKYIVMMDSMKRLLFFPSGLLTRYSGVVHTRIRHNHRHQLWLCSSRVDEHLHWNLRAKTSSETFQIISKVTRYSF